MVIAVVDTSNDFDAVVVGAGFGGMYMLHRLREAGYRVQVFEAGAGVGGTWYWNRYPGARCDIHSLGYSYSFSAELEQDWEWSELYAAQPEIERYANHVADRFDLRRDIQFDTRVIAARYDEDAAHWVVTTDRQGQAVTARYLIMAAGGYSVPNKNPVAGLESFAGESYFTSMWPDRQVDYTGKRVGVIGTGSSGTQTVTALAAEPLDHLYVFQRTANFLVPGWNGDADEEYTQDFKADYKEFREVARWSGNGALYPRVRSFRKLTAGPLADLDDAAFQQRMEDLWACGGLYLLGAVSDLMTNEDVNTRVSEYFRSKIRERVNDPQIAELLSPQGFFIGTRRIIAENGYLEVYNQPNVSLVDVKSDPIVEITPSGVKTRDREYDLDMIVFATGFDSGTGAMLQMDIVGRNGARFAEHWANGPRTYLGVLASGFPNMFMIAQPGSPSIRSHVLVSIEQHVEWISDLLQSARANDVIEIEATPVAEGAWTQHVADVAASSLLARADSQYVGANIPGKPRVYLAYLAGVGPYRRICDAVRDNAYEGLVMRTKSGPLPNSDEWSGAGQHFGVNATLV
ncbi:MAG: cyclohexanone monooxygenase [Frankiales bacterium]|nr:cyclohexanone monooxygenase [Frankiales bacterium]